MKSWSPTFNGPGTLFSMKRNFRFFISYWSWIRWTWEDTFVYMKNNMVMLSPLFLFIHKDKYIWMAEAGVVKVIQTTALWLEGVQLIALCMDGKSLWKGDPCNFSQFWPKWPHSGSSPDPLCYLICSHPISLFLILHGITNLSAPRETALIWALPGKQQGSLKHSYFTGWVVRPCLPKSKECRPNRAIIYSDRES